MISGQWRVAAARKFSDIRGTWPEGIEAKDLKSLADAYSRELAAIEPAIKAETLDDAVISWPNGDDAGLAAKNIRATLELSADAMEGCSAY